MSLMMWGSRQWIPDTDVTGCSVCSVDFTLFLRRHHCMRCANVICSSCSKSRMAVPPLHVALVRICDPCEVVLSDHDAIALALCPGADVGLMRVYTTASMAMESYAAMAGYYDLWSSYERPHIEAALATLAATEGEVVVEIGCGTGRAALSIARVVQHRGGRYFGIDLSSKMLEAASRRLTSATDIKLPSWSFVQGDATMPPLPVVQSAADALFLSFTLELFDTPALPVVLASCLAAMKPGGRIVTVSMARSGGGLAVRLYEWMHAHYPRTVDCRPIDAAALLACAGFTLVSVEQRSLCGLPIEVVLALAPG